MSSRRRQRVSDWVDLRVLAVVELPSEVSKAPSVLVVVVNVLQLVAVVGVYRSTCLQM